MRMSDPTYLTEGPYNEQHLEILLCRAFKELKHSWKIVGHPSLLEIVHHT